MDSPHQLPPFSFGRPAKAAPLAPKSRPRDQQWAPEALNPIQLSHRPNRHCLLMTTADMIMIKSHAARWCSALAPAPGWPLSWVESADGCIGWQFQQNPTRSDAGQPDPSALFLPPLLLAAINNSNALSLISTL